MRKQRLGFILGDYKAIDNAEPGRNNDTFEIKVWYPDVSEEGDPSERAGGVLQGGNIVVHAKSK